MSFPLYRITSGAICSSAHARRVEDLRVHLDRRARSSATRSTSREKSPKMLIGLEGAHASYVSIFGSIEHLRDFAPQCFDTEV
jgi:hypothetical protein